MIDVRSYLKSGAKFVDVESFDGNIKDPDYIDGALVLSVNGIELVNVKMWDLIDQLWVYLVDGLELVSQGKEFKTYFPDQAIELCVRPVNDNLVLVSVKIWSSVNQALSSREEFIRALALEAQRFFTAMGRLVPHEQRFYETILQNIRELQRWLGSA